MTQVRDEHITNAQITLKFGGILTISLLIARKQLKWVGKIIRMDNRQIPPKILTGFNCRPRCSGRRFRTTRDGIVDSLKLIWPKLSDNGALKEWRHFALCIGYWNKCADEVASQTDIFVKATGIVEVIVVVVIVMMQVIVMKVIEAVGVDIGKKIGMVLMKTKGGNKGARVELKTPQTILKIHRT